MRLTFASPFAAILPITALLILSPLNPGTPTTAHAEGPHEGASVMAASNFDGKFDTTGAQTASGARMDEGFAARKPRAGDRPPSWVLRRPSPATQTQKSVKERGSNPCMAPDPGFRGYDEWDRAPSIGQMIVPKNLRLGPNGEFDVFFHFHGHEPARKAWVQAMSSAVLVGVDLGIGSGSYHDEFQVKAMFEQLLASVEQGVAARTGAPIARAGRVGLSAWSAGYGAIGQILRQPHMQERIDSVVLLDGLHTGIDRQTMEVTKLEAFADFARTAASGEKFMFVSHSSIIPPNYASTTQTANYLIWQMGGEPAATVSRPGDPVGLDLISRFSRGEFYVRGFSGNDTLDHCAHLSLFKDVLRTHIAPRWQQ